MINSIKLKIKSNKPLYNKLVTMYAELLKQKDYTLSNLFFVEHFFINKKKVEKIKNIHKDKRCFIIGNGPSLRAADLDKLKNEVTFASNRIHVIFKETKWIPNYYCCFDDQLSKENEFMNEINADIKFFRTQHYFFTKRLNGNKCFIRTKYSRKYLLKPQFSDDISKYLYTIATVTYAAIQTAVYMGIKEIYLLGIDNNYAIERKKDGTIVENIGVKSYFSKEIKDLDGASSTYEMNIAYQAAKKYADEHGIKIYNSTRGGKLEVFERVDFDSLF